ncbi:MAG TPA: hypothetical protein VEF04_03100 [Blastocatellia bacterium]|nr:hypothetical protein [Blastocatellia bacterium]
MSPELWAIVGSLATGLILKIGDWYLNRGKDRRDARKDLREEIAELWDRCDEQDRKLAEKDKEIAELRAKLGEEMFWKQRFTAENLENQMLRRRLSDMESHINRLEQQIKELQK